MVDNGSHPLDRLERRAARSHLNLAGRNLPLLGVRSLRRFVDVRITGLAAEMTYYMILSFIPLLTAIGAWLALIQGVIGPDALARVESGLINAVEGVLSPELAEDIFVPFVQDILRQQRLGLAAGGLAVALWLASRVFRAAIRALDDAYQVEARRRLWQQWLLALAFAATSVVAVGLLLSLVIIGPLLGGGQRIAEWIGAGRAFELTWALARWPFIYLVCTAFLMWLYRVGPNVRNTWRQAFPGAVTATALLILVAVGFRFYIDIAGPGGPDPTEAEEAVRAVAQFVGAALAGLLFMWLASIVVLFGGVLNAEWIRARPELRTEPSAS